MGIPQRYVTRFSAAPFRADRVGGGFPGLKPWAEGFSPFGAGKGRKNEPVILCDLCDLCVKCSHR
jgi:hypothetical protein